MLLIHMGLGPYLGGRQARLCAHWYQPECNQLTIGVIVLTGLAANIGFVFTVVDVRGDVRGTPGSPVSVFTVCIHTETHVVGVHTYTHAHVHRHM